MAPQVVPATSDAKRALVGLRVALVILGLVGALAYETTVTLGEATARVEHTHEVIERLLAERAALQEVLAVRRAHGLTGDGALLDPYAKAVQGLGARRNGLRVLTFDNSGEQR